MAKKDLDILAAKVGEIVETRKQYIRDKLNREVHIYKINGDILYKQVSTQLRKVRKYSGYKTVEFEDKLKEICDKAAPEILKALTQYKGGKANVTLAPGTSDTVYVRAKDSVSGLDIFTFIRTTRRDRLIKYLRDPIVTDLFGNYTSTKKYQKFMEQEDDTLIQEKYSPSSAYSKKINDLDDALFGGYTKQKNSEKLVRVNNRATRSGGFSHLGHLKENAVSKRLQGIAVDSLLNDSDVIQTIFPNNEIVVNVVRDFKNRLGSFTVEVSVIEESAYANLADSAKEKKELQALGKELSKELLQKIDWPNQKASSSSREIILADLINSSIDSIGKFSKKKNKRVKTKVTPSSTTKQRSAKNNKIGAKKSLSRTTSPVSITERRELNKGSNGNKWLQLLPLINAKLTDKVAQNMTSPRLNNRTGRFAQSAKVVNVEQTPQGFPSFVFDYERDPYDVFDRTLGRAPWNTPQRDPRALVDTSVREIVREMAIARFFTRRA